jgi:hypothetical protein
MHTLAQSNRLTYALFHRYCYTVQKKGTFNPGMTPNAASKHAPDIRPCSRSSGLGASPNLPSGSEPITLKYLVQKPRCRIKPISEQMSSDAQGPNLCNCRKILP